MWSSERSDDAEDSEIGGRRIRALYPEWSNPNGTIIRVTGPLRIRLFRSLHLVGLERCKARGRDAVMFLSRCERNGATIEN